MDRIKIGPTVFEVSYVKDLVLGGVQVWGAASIGDSTIGVDASLSPQARRATVLHEVVHVCLNFAGCQEASENEGVVVALAHGMLQVLRDNPKLVEMLLEGSESR